MSDDAELHKYFTDPHKRDTAGAGLPDGDWKQRREFTYTLSAVVKVLKPANPADMNDDYQDARVLAEDAESYTVEVVYYPLNDNRSAIAENPDWKSEDAAMAAYLDSSTTANWDEAMRGSLLVELREAGIEPSRMTDRQLVERVSKWAMRRSRTTEAFSAWFVQFPAGVPTVAPELRLRFDREKRDASVTDQEMFANEILGRDMFTRKVHGSCTSSSIYLETVLRALGIPTRIVVATPPVDPNDEQQVRSFLAQIHHHATKAAVAEGLLSLHGTVSHLFNEVYVGRRWVRPTMTTSDRTFSIVTTLGS